MKEFEYTIKDELGIHARPAGLLVKEASKYESDIRIIKGDKEVDARRLIAIMSLATKFNETIRFKVEGIDEDQAALGLEEFMKENL